MLLNVVIGDWSCDGHNRYETFVLDINGTIEELDKAVKLGEKKLGFKLNNYCCEYEDSSIPIEFVQALIDSGFKHEFELFDPNDKNSLSDLIGDQPHITVEDYLQIYMHIIRLGGVQCSWITSEHEKHIGGYGLYH